jgi:hypothetical protein
MSSIAIALETGIEFDPLRHREARAARDLADWLRVRGLVGDHV